MQIMPIPASRPSGSKFEVFVEPQLPAVASAPLGVRANRAAGSCPMAAATKIGSDLLILDWFGRRQADRKADRPPELMRGKPSGRMPAPGA